LETNDWEALERFRPASDEFIDWLRTYGPMEIFGTEPDEFDPNDFETNLIWTESWRIKRLVSSGFEESGESTRAITNYYVSTIPWSADSGTLEILAEGMVPCPKCKGQDENKSCVECDDDGEYLVDFCELIF
jgi:hypothetical protein